MKGILFFDVETNGLPNFKLPPDDPSQPHIVQIAAILSSAYGEVIGQFKTLIRPDGWEISDELVEIHGINTEMCADFGVSIRTALKAVFDFKKRSICAVAHNVSFDRFLLRSEAERQGMTEWLDADSFEWECTIEMTRPICQLPPTPRMIRAGFDGFKSPKLIEAHQHLFCEGFDKAHDAMADVMACKRIYFECQRLLAEKEQQ